MAIRIEKIAELYNLFRECSQISTDTRKIDKDALFVCLRGETFDGNVFASEAIAKGAKFVIIDNEKFDTGDSSILVENSLKTLQELAHYYRMKFSIPVIGITGTNGKTTTKELIHAVMSQKYKTHATVGNFNNHIGVPLTLLSMPENTEIAIVEMGANHPFEIKELCEIASPDFGIITSIGKAHLEGFGSLEGVIKTKKELYDYIETHGKMVFVSADNELLMNLSQNIDRQTYGKTTNSDFYGELLPNEGLLEMKFNNRNIKSHLVGDYNFVNMMAAIACGKYFGLNEDKIALALEEYTPKNQRSQLIKYAKNTIVLDAYNANPTSMEAALKSLSESQFPFKSAILGDMLELGNESIKEHLSIIKLLISLKLDRCILIGPIFHSLPHPFLSFEKSEDAMVYIKDHSFENQYILIKGSRGIQVEKVLQAFE